MDTTKNKKKMILVVEDSTHMRPRFKKEIPEIFKTNNIDFTEAYELIVDENLGDAMDDFLYHKDNIICIVVCGKIGENFYKSIPFVKNIRNLGFTKLMLAASIKSEYNNLLVEAGCDTSVEKQNMVETLFELLQKK